jgi:hypothetical protein
MIVFAAVSSLFHYSADPWDYEKISAGETRKRVASILLEIRILYLLSKRGFSME